MHRIWLTLITLALFIGPEVHGADRLLLEQPMLQDPNCDEPPREYAYQEGLVALWTKALSHSDSELRRSAADTIALGKQRGVPGLNALHNDLAKLLGRADEAPTVRRAAAHALVVLEAREHADVLAAAAAKDGLEVAQFVEPTLARWQDNRLKSVWLGRLADPTIQLYWRLLAARCLGETQESEARDPLVKVVENRQESMVLRLAAARALAQITSSGLVPHVRQLVANRAPDHIQERLLGITLLQQHSDAETIALLGELATDPEPLIASAAFGQLFALDPRHLDKFTDSCLASPDAGIRRWGAKALVHRGDVAAIQALAKLLDDRNPELRRWVAQSLFELAAKPELRPVVIAAAEQGLASESWRELEQSILLAAHLKHTPVTSRLIELLPHTRGEVAVTAAGGLRMLKVPDTLPALLAHAERQYERFNKGDYLIHETMQIVDQFAEIFQAFGETRYEPAEPLLRKFVPKNLALGEASRSAACWALGHLHADKPDVELARQLAERLADFASEPPEVIRVRRMCAVSLGRMRAETELQSLKTFASAEGVTSEVGIACWWSIERMTDERRPPLPKLEQSVSGWFLQPAK